MTFEEADILCDMIVAFMVSMGGPYMDAAGWLEEEVMWALGSGQYVMKVDDRGRIRYFASLWFLNDCDLAEVMSMDRCDREKPKDRVSGNRLYIAEAAAAPGEMVNMVKHIRRHRPDFVGAFWHRPERDRVAAFNRQKGA